MLGPIGSEIMRLFRLLSPDEIEKYVTHEEMGEISRGVKVAANGDSMNFGARSSKHSNGSFPKEDQAKIIPINESVENELKSQAKRHLVHHGDQEFPVNRNEANQELSKRTAASIASAGGSGLESIGVLSASKIREIEDARLKKENDTKDSATVFLLKERNKMRQSKKMMVEQRALRQYQDNAAQEFHEEVFDEESGEVSSPDLKGILLNKKHY